MSNVVGTVTPYRIGFVYNYFSRETVDEAENMTDVEVGIRRYPVYYAESAIGEISALVRHNHRSSITSQENIND